jgi:hypothetical protein
MERDEQVAEDEVDPDLDTDGENERVVVLAAGELLNTAVSDAPRVAVPLPTVHVAESECPRLLLRDDDMEEAKLRVIEAVGLPTPLIELCAREGVASTVTVGVSVPEKLIVAVEMWDTDGTVCVALHVEEAVLVIDTLDHADAVDVGVIVRSVLSLGFDGVLVRLRDDRLEGLWENAPVAVTINGETDFDGDALSEAVWRSSETLRSDDGDIVAATDKDNESVEDNERVSDVLGVPLVVSLAEPVIDGDGDMDVDGVNTREVVGESLVGERLGVEEKDWDSVQLQLSERVDTLGFLETTVLLSAALEDSDPLVSEKECDDDDVAVLEIENVLDVVRVQEIVVLCVDVPAFVALLEREFLTEGELEIDPVEDTEWTYGLVDVDVRETGTEVVFDDESDPDKDALCAAGVIDIEGDGRGEGVRLIESPADEVALWEREREVNEGVGLVVVGLLDCISVNECEERGVASLTVAVVLGVSDLVALGDAEEVSVKLAEADRDMLPESESGPNVHDTVCESVDVFE